MNDSTVALLAYLTQLFGGSTGWAIVAISLGVRVALLPLTIRISRRAIRNQEIIRTLQPEIGDLKKRFEKEPELLFREMQQLYRKHGYNPFDLPTILALLVQLPVFSILYRAIGSALVAGERFYWIRSLASPDAWLTVTILAFTGAAAHFAPGMSNGARTTIVAVQLGITLLIVWKLAAGYSLYWASSNVVGLAQTLWLRREAARNSA